MGNENTIKELEKIRIDCMYGKKKHYNARDRYAKYHLRIGIAIVIVTAIMGTAVYYSISKNESLAAQIITGVFTIAITVLATLQTYLNFEKRALMHKIAADRYLSAMKDAQLFISYCKDGSKSMDQAQSEIGRLSKEIKEIQKDEPETSESDYKRARAGVKDGEERYAEEET